MKRFVLDASYAIGWVIPKSEQTPAGLKYFRALSQREAEALVPALWPDEMANVLLTLGSDRRSCHPTMISNGSTTVLYACRSRCFPDDLEHSLIEIWPLAQAHGLSVYDASYLHLALREQVPLATYDRQLIAAATQGRSKALAVKTLVAGNDLTPPAVVIMIGITPPQVDALPKMSGS